MSQIATTSNIIGANVNSTGTVSAVGNIVTGTANVSAGNVLAATLVQGTTVSASGNVIGSNLTTAGQVTSTGNITGGNIMTSGVISAAGNILLSGALLDSAQLDIQTTAGNANIVFTPNGTGNVNLGRVSASGNVTALTFYGSGAGLSSIPNSSLTNNSVTFNGVTVALGSSGTITATATNALTIGTGLGGTSYNGSSGVTITNTGVLSLANGGGITASASTGAITLGSTATSANTASAIVARGASGEFSAGAITAASLTVSTGNVTLGNLVNGGSNGVGNIGSATTYFNTVFAKATSAQYADLAEKYTADHSYEPGTVVCFGGSKEITVTDIENDYRIAGVISTNPSYIMNSTLEGEHVVTVALTGRVPTKVIGPVRKGDMMVSAGFGRARACVSPSVGTVIGKALADFNGGEGVIEVVVGRL